MKKGEKYLCVNPVSVYFLKGKVYDCLQDNFLFSEIGSLLGPFSSKFELVNNKPTHYQTASNYDVIDFCNDNKLNFNRGSALKYIARAGKKDNEIQDLEKAIDFSQREIKFLRDEIHR